MPRVTIRTGIFDERGNEEVLSEYFCDSPGCPRVAEHVLGVIRELRQFSAVCREHALSHRTKTSDLKSD